MVLSPHRGRAHTGPESAFDTHIEIQSGCPISVFDTHIITEIFMEKELRRRQSILSVTGNGVMFLGMWSFLKINLYFILGRSAFLEEIIQDESIDEGTLLLVMYIISMIIASLELFFRIRVGRGAIAEARDRNKPKRYIGMAMTLIILYAFAVIFTVLNLDFYKDTFWDQLASMIVDVTSLVMLIELVSSASVLRKLKHQMG